MSALGRACGGRARAVLGGVLAASTLLACRGSSPAAASADTSVAARPELVGIRTEGRVMTVPGAMVDVVAEVGGRVVSMRVAEGDEVARGAVLAELDDREARAALDEARAQVAAAQADLAFADARYVRVDGLARRGTTAAEALDAVTRDRAAARARLDAATAAVDRLTAMLAKHRITAPIAGRVIDRPVDRGQTIAPGTRLLTIADLTRRQIEAEVDESDIARVHVGARVTMSADGFDSTWVGRVTSIPDVVVPRRLRPEDPARLTDTRVLLVKIDVPPDAPFKLGQRVDLRIATE
ncbi:MAG: efflux RND transporter periplasmic adaptor subunit [Gemmatimonadaceae bacterium]|nr:efflux RND transporter periplasmic adaptor subunit [Gemmatimonadaceae bacterium]